MDLFEYQGKQYFARFGIPVSPGGVADSVDEAVKQADCASPTFSCSRRWPKAKGSAS